MHNSNLSFDVGSVLPGKLLLSSGRDEDITVCLQDVPVIGLSIREAHNSAMLL